MNEDTAAIPDPTRDPSSSQDDDSTAEYGNSTNDEDDSDALSEDEWNPGTAQDFKADKNGLIRVGRQPVKSHDPNVRTSPRAVANVWVEFTTRINQNRTDAKFPGATPQRIRQSLKDISKQLQGSFVECRDGKHVKRFCDYTGIEILWSPGPRMASLEAVYPFVISNGHLGYHESPNVAIIMRSLNQAKSRRMTISLPAVAVWLNALDEPDFLIRKARWAWAFNALSNAAILQSIFHGALSHKKQLKKWAEWDLPKQKNILNILRTGTRMPDVDEALAGKAVWEVLGEVTPNPNRRTRPMSETALEDAAKLYQTLLRIARSYDLTTSEFEYYCTIPSPRARSNGDDDRVFYPYHILSRPHAVTIGWD